MDEVEIENNLWTVVEANRQGHVPSTASVPPSVAAVPLLDTKIKWAMSSLMPAFDDEVELEQAKQGVLQSYRSGHHLSYFWQHPVRFLPKPTEKNLYRTVMIDYIPQTTTYQEILEHVRSGALESIQLFPPLGSTTNYLTTRIVFIHEIPAVSMIMHYQKRRNQGDPIKIRGTPVRFWQVYAYQLPYTSLH